MADDSVFTFDIDFAKTHLGLKIVRFLALISSVYIGVCFMFNFISFHFLRATNDPDNYNMFVHVVVHAIINLRLPM